MLPNSLDDRTLSEIQKLIEANFTGRDELYAAAESLDDQARQHICRHLAKQLADNAILLQQIVAANGNKPAGPLDTNKLAEALFHFVRARRGDPDVLRLAAEGEHQLKDDYDRAVHITRDENAKALLEQQREEVEFAEEVLRNLKDSTTL